MKYMNHVKSGLLAMAFACAGICFTGCEDDVVINTGNSDKLDTVDGVYGYVKSAAGARELTPISVFGDKVATGHLYFELSKAAEQDVTVTFKVDEDVLEAYNKKNGTSYKMYPADKLSLANGGTATIKAGEQKSASVELNINAGGTIGQTYAVAVSASANNGVEVSTNNQEYIYLVKPLAAIPESISKGDILTHCFVEVNDENILNMGEYTMKSNGKPFFDVVSIFAANINVDSKTGRVHVFCNDQVSFLLRNADKFIRPLQAKGIKVAMTILGNHDEAGMGNLSEAAAKDFAKELKAYLDIYGLDGIDFDDEYTNYNNSNPGPGFETRSRANFARLVYECRQVFGNKLIGVYEYGSLDSPDGEVEGMKVGDIVDYMTYGYYQNQNPEGAFGREESHFENLPKSKYAPLPWKINDELNGGWSGFDKSKFQKVKDEGYGIQMFYNPKPLVYQYYTLLSEISKVLFDDEVEWSGKYWSRIGEAYQGKMLGYEDLVGEWKVTSSNSLFTYVDEEGNPRWWDWKGSQEFEKNVIIEKDEEGTGYVVYNWGTFPEITGKYPMHCDYYNGALLIYPQTIHEGDAEDPATYKMHFGTCSKNFQWKAYPNYDDYYMDGAIAPNGDMHIYGLGNRWAINPYKYVGGEIETDIFPDVPYFVSENYTMKKVR